MEKIRLKQMKKNLCLNNTVFTIIPFQLLIRRFRPVVFSRLPTSSCCCSPMGREDKTKHWVFFCSYNCWYIQRIYLLRLFCCHCFWWWSRIIFYWHWFCEIISLNVCNVWWTVRCVCLLLWGKCNNIEERSWFFFIYHNTSELINNRRLTSLEPVWAKKRFSSNYHCCTPRLKVQLNEPAKVSVEFYVHLY